MMRPSNSSQNQKQHELRADADHAAFVPAADYDVVIVKPDEVVA